MKININDTCKVKLTEHGINRLREKDNVTYTYDFNYSTKILKTQLWNIMSIFGDMLYNGQPKLPFERNSLEIELI